MLRSFYSHKISGCIPEYITANHLSTERRILPIGEMSVFGKIISARAAERIMKEC